jgi:SsrA-binding protein
VHIGEYPPAGASRQHIPARDRILLANKREIRKLAEQTVAKGVTIVPLKLYFVRGRAKLLIGVARGKQKADKREDIAKREARRDMDRALSRRR